MSANDAISMILHNSTGKRASGREMLVSEKRSILDPKIAAGLREQWNSAGRDNAKVLMHLTENDGANSFYVTGWDGKDKFVALTESGLTYVDYRKLEKMAHDADWNPETRLIEVRTPLLRENMERTDIDMLLDRIKKTLTKSNKTRRKSRLRNMGKFFDVSVVESDTNAEKAANSGPDSEMEFEKVKEKDDRVPEGPKAPSTTKLPTGRFKESFSWDQLDANGRPVRRGLQHPWMESNKTEPQLDKRQHVRQNSEGSGGSGSGTPGGNKTDAQLSDREQIDVRSESNQTQPQLDKRQHVRLNKESGPSCGVTLGGNKTDAQLTDREQVDVRSEAQSLGAKDSSDRSDDEDTTTYAGETGKDKEFSSRPKIAVRHEALNLKSKGKSLFGPDASKKAPMGAKKPLLMLVLMSKGKKAPKRAMSEGTTFCPRCAGTHADDGHPKAKFGPMRGLFPAPPKTRPGQAPEESCPTCAAKRAQTGGGLKLRLQMGKKPPSTFESRLNRSSLRLAEGKMPESFLANIEKMRAKGKGSADKSGAPAFGKKKSKFNLSKGL